MSSNGENDSLLTDIKNYVGDARYPMTKEDLISWAEKSHATAQVINAIKDMSYSKFDSIDDVTKDYVND